MLFAIVKRVDEQKRTHQGHTLVFDLGGEPVRFCLSTCMETDFAVSSREFLCLCISRQHMLSESKGHSKVPHNESWGDVTLSPDPSSGSTSQ